MSHYTVQDKTAKLHQEQSFRGLDPNQDAAWTGTFWLKEIDFRKERGIDREISDLQPQQIY